MFLVNVVPKQVKPLENQFNFITMRGPNSSAGVNMGKCVVRMQFSGATWIRLFGTAGSALQLLPVQICAPRPRGEPIRNVGRWIMLRTGSVRYWEGGRYGTVLINFCSVVTRAHS